MIITAHVLSIITGKYSEHLELVGKVGVRDTGFLETRISDHITKKDPLASIRSR